MKKHNTIFNIVANWFIAIAIAILISYFIKTLFIDTYKINNRLMEPTILNNERLCINKIANLSKGSVILFKLYKGKKNEINLVKRIVAEPGDTLEIKKKIVYINKKKENGVCDYNFTHRIMTDDLLFDSIFFKNNNIYVKNNKTNELGVYYVELTDTLAKKIKKLKNIINIKKVSTDKGIKSSYVAPEINNNYWNTDNYGPIIIPKKNHTLNISYHNYEIYKHIILEYENIKIVRKNKKLYVDNKLITNYTFKNNYCFVMNDNRDYSNDSRQFGFVPTRNIIGEVSYILFSFNKKKSSLNKKRIFKKVK